MFWPAKKHHNCIGWRRVLLEYDGLDTFVLEASGQSWASDACSDNVYCIDRSHNDIDSALLRRVYRV
jgi:hypothetical protein